MIDEKITYRMVLFNGDDCSFDTLEDAIGAADASDVECVVIKEQLMHRNKWAEKQHKALVKAGWIQE